MSAGLVVALVDPGTLVARDVRAVLSERALPVKTLHLFHTAGGGSGFLSRDEDEAAYVAPLEPDSLETCQVAFLCGARAAAARFLSRRTDRRCLVLDLSGLTEGGDFATVDAPLPAGDVFLLHDPTALVLARCLRALAPLGEVRHAAAVVDRPCSELGKDALDELFQQAISLASFRSLPKKTLHGQLAFNVLQPPDSAEFERRVRADVARLLGGGPPLSVLSSRAGVFHGHLVRLVVSLSGAAPPAAALLGALTSSAEPFSSASGSGQGPVECAGRDDVLVLRAESEGTELRLALAFDHLRGPGAVEAVRLAERAVAERGLLAEA